MEVFMSPILGKILACSRNNEISILGVVLIRTEVKQQKTMPEMGVFLTSLRYAVAYFWFFLIILCYD